MPEAPDRPQSDRSHTDWPQTPRLSAAEARGLSEPLFVNARFLTQATTGVQRVGIEISRQLKALHPEVHFLTPNAVVQEEIADELGAEIVGRFKGHLWEQLELPRYARGPLLSLCNAGPVAHRRHLVTLHDAAVYAVPEAYSLSFRLWYKRMFAGLSRRAKAIATVSRFSQAELAKHVGVAAAESFVIYNAAEHVLRAAADEGILTQHALHGKPYLLAVGSSSPHKNYGRLLRALARLGAPDFQVVLAGGANPRVHVQGGELPAGVTHVGYVSDGELRALFEHAAGFVHPAYYEGFGIPPLEAMTFGCPVLAADAASLPEVCGDAALYFDPFDEAAIAAKVQQFMADDALRQRLKEAGYLQVQKFHWQRAALEVLGVAQARLGLT